MLSVLLEPFLDPSSRTHVIALASALLVGGVLVLHRGRSLAQVVAPFRTRSTVLDVQLLMARQLLKAIGLFPVLGGSYTLAVGLVGALDQVFGVPDIDLSAGLVSVVYTLVLFIVWDASRFVTHWLMHRVPFLWAFHQVHHSASALTPLTFHRIHPVESVVYQVRGVLVTGVMAGLAHWLFRADAVVLEVFGVHAVGWGMNVVSGNLRHSEIPWSFGSLERWLLSPSQHQIHHGRGTDHVNLGTWLALWDRMAGTYRSGDQPPRAYGILEANHDHDLLSAWFGPFRELFVRGPSSDDPHTR